MAGNSFGRHFVLTSFGESHGSVIGGVIDGCPSGLVVDESLIQPFLDRRKPGSTSMVSQRQESDRVSILSGVYQGKTTGAPIAFIIPNTNVKSSDYLELAEVYRPGHADYVYHQKYGHVDFRGGGRASARETAVRVVAGAVAQLFLAQQGISFMAYLAQVGDLCFPIEDLNYARSHPHACPCPRLADELSAYIQTIREARDSVGALLGLEIEGVPCGLGEPVYNKISAQLASAMMGINAVKAVEIGDGFNVVSQRGSEHRDAMKKAGFLSNHAGGITAGITTGQTIHLRVAFKPTSSIPQPIATLNHDGNETTALVKGRHDPCVGLRAAPILEAMGALVIMDAWLARFGEVSLD